MNPILLSTRFALLPVGCALLCATACNGDLSSTVGPGEMPETQTDTPDLQPADQPTPDTAAPDGPLKPLSPEACAALTEPVPGAAPLRRLNKREYSNTLRDLFGVDEAATAELPGEGDIVVFDTDSDLLTGATELQVERYRGIARELAQTVAADFASYSPCTEETDACAGQFINDLGKKVFRRPLEAQEVTTFNELFSFGNENIDFGGGIELVVEALLQDPHFLYRVEAGDPATAQGSVRALTSWERATRLSYMFWGSTPDDELLAAAESGQLDDAAGVRTAAERLMMDERTKPTVLNYIDQWMGLKHLDDVELSPDAFPGFTDGTTELMKQETSAFINHIMWDSDASLNDLLSAPYTFVNRELADFYGFPAPAGAGFEKVEVPDRNFGVLSQGSFLASHASGEQTSPIRRGVFVAKQVLCISIPEPPSDVDVTPLEIDPELTTRERTDLRTGDVPCVTCHQLFNPAGYALEHFDASGRWREQESGHEIDDTVTLNGTDIEQEVVGVAGLASALTTSDDAVMCAVQKLGTFAYGRSFTRTGEDGCAALEAYNQFSTSKNLRELMLTLTQTDSFLFRSEVN